MKIETKLTLNNMKKNLKRTIYTTISVTLCAFLIITTLLVATSISDSLKENTAGKYNDYHFIIKNINLNSFNKIKAKEYISQIYLQENGGGQLYEIDNLPDSFQIVDGLNIYIKYDNYKKTCAYTNDILETLDLKYTEAYDKCELNTSLLNAYGLIDVDLKNGVDNEPICQARLNFTYILNLMMIIIVLIFSILSFIILYNAFLITINERKKEYAVLNSIGATEGQILKITFLENFVIGIVGTIIGLLISVLGSSILLKMLNNILDSSMYNFKLTLDIKYIILSFVIIMINIYMASLIPNARASSTSVMQEIKNNKQITNKKNKSVFEKILPIEGKLAYRNLKRNKNKYRIITILLVVCMTSYITITTYINYEKVAEDLIDEYDVDAQLALWGNSNEYYKEVLNNYVTTYGDEIEYSEYKKMGLYAQTEPEDAIIDEYFEDLEWFNVCLIGLDDKTYNNYINDLDANSGDYIIYNNIALREEKRDGEEYIYKYYTAFKKNNNFDIKLVEIKNYNKESDKFEIINDYEDLGKNYILTDVLPNGYREIKNTQNLTIFTNMETFNNIEEKVQASDIGRRWFYWGDGAVSGNFAKIKCENIINFSNYMKSMEQKQDIDISSEYYSLENKEKIIYTNILELILQTIILTIIIIGITSSINIINASLCEREEEFKALSRLGATKGNINKILIYENIYMFMRATIISIILSIPIVYMIIKFMERTIIIDKLLIPFNNIGVFILLLFIISLVIAIYSTKFVKEE